MSDTDEHPLEQFILDSRKERISSVLKKRTRDIIVVLDRVHNAHNISAVIRSADAFGIQNVHYLGEQFDVSSGITIGADRWIDLIQHPSLEHLLGLMTADGYELVVLAPQDKKVNPDATVCPVHDLPFEKKLALVFGNERDGVRPEIAAAARYQAYIPMIGFVESLNISVAAAITLYCSMLSGVTDERRPSPLTAEAQRTLKSRWLMGEVREAEKVLERVRGDTEN